MPVPTVDFPSLSRRATVLVGGLLLAAFACARPAEWQGSITTRDGVTYVDNPAEGLWQDAGRPPFRLELEQTFGVEDEPEEKLLGFITGVAVDERGNVYVLDRRFNEIIAFAPDGEVIWRRGRAGEGPGELQGANGMAWGGRRGLYVSNLNGARIDTFDLDGNFVSSHSLADLGMSTAYVAGFLEPDTLVVWSWGRDRDGVTIGTLEVGDTWRLKAEFFVAGGSDDDPALMDGTNIDVQTGGGRIRTGHRLRYLLREFDDRGNVARVIGRDVPDLVPTLSYRGTGWNFGEFKAPLAFPDGSLLVPRFRARGVESAEQFIAELERRATEGIREEFPVYEAAFDLLDDRGRYIGSIEEPGSFEETALPALVGPDGRLYTRVFEPFAQVRRYRLDVER